MENLIRSIIFIGAIIVLVVTFLPNRPAIGDIMEFVVPFAIPFIFISIFIFQAKNQIKKNGGVNKNWLEILKQMEEQSRRKK